MKESAVERKLYREIRRLGGRAVKMATYVAGMPDRLILLPNGQCELVELKANDGSPSPIQKERHKQLAAIGHPVYLVYGAAGVVDYINGLKERL